jgi:hypothetical protein
MVYYDSVTKCISNISLLYFLYMFTLLHYSLLSILVPTLVFYLPHTEKDVRWTD